MTFSLPAFAAEGAQEVKVLGDFNDWSWENGITMKAKKDEYQAVAELEAGRDYQFRYLIDKTYWENDHQADAYVPSGVQGVDNSVVIVEPAPAPKAKAKPAKKAAPKKAAPKKATAKTATKKKTAKKAAGKDDLKKIEGIGPKIAGLFADAGITTFEGLATAKKSQLKEILQAAGPRYKMHDPTTWTKQAKLAAAGKWDELDKLQQELKGGKRKE